MQPLCYLLFVINSNHYITNEQVASHSGTRINTRRPTPCTECNAERSAAKTELKTFERKCLTYSKTFIFNKFIEQIHCFKCLNYYITYKKYTKCSNQNWFRKKKLKDFNTIRVD